MSKKLYLVLIYGAVLFLITGCFNETSKIEDIHQLLESVVDKEKKFEEQQKPLVQLEKKEKEIYSKIISLGMKEFEQIQQLSQEALEVVNKREKYMDIEEQSLQTSQQTFKKLGGLIDKLHDEDLQKEGKKLQTIMKERYQVHDELYKSYKQGIVYDKELYQLFQKENLSIDELEAQIDKINDTYKKVLECNENFNEQTKKYNEQKFYFYKKAGLEYSESSTK